MKIKAKAVVIVSLSHEADRIPLAKALGFIVILLGTNLSIESIIKADVPVEVDLNDENLVIQELRQLALDYELVGAHSLNEYRIPLTSRIATAFGIRHGIPENAARLCRNKILTRMRLAEANISPVGFVAYRGERPLQEALSSFRYPVMIKPSNDAGSNMVARCANYEDARTATTRIQKAKLNWVGQCLDSAVLIEEFLCGPELSVECATQHGETTVLAFTGKSVDPRTNVEIGHLMPATLSSELSAEIAGVVCSAHRALGIDNAVTHTEVKLTPNGPRIVEVNCRPGGDYISILHEKVYGSDLRDLSLKLALGMPIGDLARRRSAQGVSAVKFFVSERGGKLTYSDTPEMTGLVDCEMYFEAGAAVTATSNNYDRLGHAIVQAANAKEATQLMQRLEENLCVFVNGES